VLSQENISAATPLGANLVPGGGATFRVWAPNAQDVYLNPDLATDGSVAPTPARLMSKDVSGYWTGFEPTAGDGYIYRYYVVGYDSSGYKRDPYARELTNATFPDYSCIVRASNSYPWHDEGFHIPDLSELIIYQLHVGVYAVPGLGVSSNFLDILGKIEYLADLGINMLQPLPITEQEQGRMGYAGGDYFSPDLPFACYNAAALPAYLATANALLAKKGKSALALADISSGVNQLKVLVDLAHLYGMAVSFDVVYGHGGGFNGDDHCLYYMDRRAPVGVNNNDSLYFTDKGVAGGLAFALWNPPVAQFLLDNAAFYLNECHADGFRYDEISQLLQSGQGSGWDFCRALTGHVRSIKDRALQNAEFWLEGGGLPNSQIPIVSPASSGGTGFDVVQHDQLRNAVRYLIQSASGGGSASLSIKQFASALYPAGMDHGWRAVTCLENHDLVYAGHNDAVPRIPALADPSNHRSWYARSRTRVATALLLLAPGIPQLFMGQEVLEDKLWFEDPGAAGNLIWWAGLATDDAMGWQLRCTRDLIALRRAQPALRGDAVNAFCTDDYARVLAFHRWLEGSGQDAIVVASLSEDTIYNYSIGFPFAGYWKEAFNSDVYDHWVNPQVAGNNGGIVANGPPAQGFASSAAITIPANGVVVFSRG
jgi:1,4-alpha-glucan branching enzyme